MSLLIQSLNRLLRQSPGATELLSHHAGQVVRFDLTFKQLDFCIANDGSLKEAATTSPDASLNLPAGLVARLPFFGLDALRQADFSGDAALLQTLDKVWRDLSWDVEAELAPILGNVVAHRITTAGRDTVRTLHRTAQSLQYNASEYIVEEIELMARKVDVGRFNNEVDALADDVGRLEARLRRLDSSKS